MQEAVKPEESESVSRLEFPVCPCPASMGKSQQPLSSFLEPDVPVEIGCPLLGASVCTVYTI